MPTLAGRITPTPDTAWAAPPANEDDIPPDVRASLGEDLASLEASARAEGVSPYIRDLILKNVTTLRAGLRLYGVTGLGAVADALSASTGSLVAAKGRLVEELRKGGEPTKTAVEKLQGLIGRVVKTAENVEKVDRGVKAGAHLYNAASDVLTALGQSISGTPSA